MKITDRSIAPDPIDSSIESRKSIESRFGWSSDAEFSASDGGMTTRATLGRSIGVDASRPPCVGTCVERATTTTSGEDVGFVKIRAVDDGNGDAEDERATTSEREGEDAGTFGAGAFALDLRGWKFKARTQAVRALGAIGRMSAGTLKVEFRDEHEQHRARTEARGGDAGAPAGASWRLHGAGGWMFDLKSLAEETRKRVKRGKIEGNQTWREIAVALGAPHGRSGACGYAARRLWERWLEAFERERDEIDVASRAAEYAQAEETLGKDDLEVIHALVALEFRASGDPPARAVAENVRNFNPTRPYLITQLRSRRPTLLLEPYPKVSTPPRPSRTREDARRRTTDFSRTFYTARRAWMRSRTTSRRARNPTPTAPCAARPETRTP